MQDFTTGDTVYTAHETTQKFGIYEVSNAIVDSVDHWYRVETTSGRFIKCSPTHLFMINGFKKSAQCLKLSDELMIADGETFVKEKLKSIQIFEETVNVYKIEVADAHTYLTDNMIWQHNFTAPGGTA